MEHLKNGTVAIRQHVETTPMVSEDIAVGSIITSSTYLQTAKQFGRMKSIHTFAVVGQHKVFKFIGEDYVSTCPPEKYTRYADDVIVEDAEVISYLRDQARKSLGSLIQECEEGVFDD
tara:strand:+ start:114 stop:467 length:354 start_codon:yes stop_codon:yes gene_type:complete